MPRFSFIVEIDELERDDETWIDFLATRPFLATLTWRDFQTYVDCQVEAEAAQVAVDTVMAELAKTELKVLRIVIDLVGVPDMAVDFEVSRETARLWANGHRRNGFPKRYTQVGNKSVWPRSDVHAWAVTNNLVSPSEPEPLPVAIAEIFNGELAKRRLNSSPQLPVVA